MENTLLVRDVLYIVGAITAIIAFVNVLKKPFSDLNDKITAQDKKFDEQEEMLEKMQKDMKAQQTLMNTSLKVQLLTMQHMVYGNHTDAIKKKLEELESVIIDR